MKSGAIEGSASAMSSGVPAAPGAESGLLPGLPADESHAGLLQQRYFRSNYTAHILEGGLFMGAMAFLNAETVMPVMIHELGGSTLLVALMPAMMVVGFSIPPLLTAHLVERFNKMKPYVVTMGFFQRLPFLAAGLTLLFAGQSHPGLSLYVVALAPFFSGLFGGALLGGYLELISRIIPPRRLSSGWAIRFIIGGGIGILAGGMVQSILSRHPGPSGFGILHLIAVGLMFLSWGIFFRMREVKPEQPPSGLSISFRDNLGRLSDILHGDRPLRLYILSRMGSTGIFILLPFLSLHILEITARPPEFIGALLIVQMVGGIGGNILAGYLGDRYGGRVLMVISLSSYLVICLSLLFVSSPFTAGVLYFVPGAGTFLSKVGAQTLMIEFSPPDRRPTYVAIVSIIMMPCLLGAACLSALLRELGDGILLLLIATVLVVLIGLAGALRMPEPRSTKGLKTFPFNPEG